MIIDFLFYGIWYRVLWLCLTIAVFYISKPYMEKSYKNSGNIAFISDIPISIAYNERLLIINFVLGLLVTLIRFN